jgi:hypothetical protein
MDVIIVIPIQRLEELQNGAMVMVLCVFDLFVIFRAELTSWLDAPTV